MTMSSPTNQLISNVAFGCFGMIICPLGVKIAADIYESLTLADLHDFLLPQQLRGESRFCGMRHEAEEAAQ